MELDFSGYTLADARRLLNRAGIIINEIQVTAPPKSDARHYDDTYRIIRMRLDEDGRAVILVCNPEAGLDKPL